MGTQQPAVEMEALAVVKAVALSEVTAVNRIIGCRAADFEFKCMNEYIVDSSFYGRHLYK